MSEVFLQTTWFALWGLLWAIYFALDGFDLGAGALGLFIREPNQRRLLGNTLGPFWDGNEVWLITAGGVTFAAFPRVYATMFSSMYGPLMIVLGALVLRGVSLEFLHMSDGAAWRRTWTWVLGITSLVAALLFGVAFGNIFQGVLLDSTGYHGTVLGLLNPYGLLTGLLFVLAFLFNGSAWMAFKPTEEPLRERGRALAVRIWPLLLLAAAAFLVYSPFATGLMANFVSQPIFFVVPALAVLSLVAARVFIGRKQGGLALLAGSSTVLLTVLTTIIGLYPNMFPSSIDPAYSLTAFNASSSVYTLRTMLIVTVIFLPLVLVYQAWFYRLFVRPEPSKDTGYEGVGMD